jgi:polyhydroxyalkanoate synthesis regulator phasin
MMSHAEPHSIEPTSSPVGADHPIGSPRNFVLACIGLLSLLADEIPTLAERSVQRGSLVVERAQAEAKRRRAPATETADIDADLQNELSRRGLPTHKDFVLLLQQVTALEQQIDRIAAQRAPVE